MLSVRWVAASRARTITPLVSRSSRCTMRAVGHRMDARATRQSAFSGPMPGTLSSPLDLSSTTSHWSAWMVE
jgi:hypothetical protein